MFVRNSSIWVGLGGGSSSLLYMVLAGVAHLSWRISDGFTHMSETPAGVAKMSRDGKASFSPCGFSIYQGKWTLTWHLRAPKREKKSFRVSQSLVPCYFCPILLVKASRRVTLELRERKIDPTSR